MGLSSSLLLFLFLCLPCVHSESSFFSAERSAVFDLFLQITTPDYWSPQQIQFFVLNHHCLWPGVSCNSDQSVVSLQLSNKSLSGDIPSSVFQLKNLKVLDLSNNKLKGKISSELSQFKKLQYLNLSLTLIDDLEPKSFKGLKKLKTLDISSTRIESFPDLVGNTPELTVLNVSNTPIDSIPEKLDSLKKLQILDIHNIYSFYLPSSWNFPVLKTLVLDGDSVSDEKVLPTLPSLEILSWTNGPFRTFPTALLNLTGLTRLTLDGGYLGQIPEEFNNLINLQYFSCSECWIKQVSVWKHQKLETLILDVSNPLPEIDVSFLSLLKVFSVRALRILPSLSHLVQLVEFEGRSLQSLPEFPKNLQHLTLGSVSNVTWPDSLSMDFPQLQSVTLLGLANMTFPAFWFSTQKGTVLDSLKLFEIGSCENMTGSLPQTFDNTPNLVSFEIYDCPEIQGTISPSIGKLKKLEQLFLRGLSINGTIPSSLGKLNQLNLLYLDDNTNLTGPVPSELVSLSNLKSLQITGNNLSSKLSPQLVYLEPSKICDLSNPKQFTCETDLFFGSVCGILCSTQYPVEGIWIQEIPSGDTYSYDWNWNISSSKLEILRDQSFTHITKFSLIHSQHDPVGTDFLIRRTGSITLTTLAQDQKGTFQSDVNIQVETLEIYLFEDSDWKYSVCVGGVDIGVWVDVSNPNKCTFLLLGPDIFAYPSSCPVYYNKAEFLMDQSEIQFGDTFLFRTSTCGQENRPTQIQPDSQYQGGWECGVDDRMESCFPSADCQKGSKRLTQ